MYHGRRVRFPFGEAISTIYDITFLHAPQLEVNKIKFWRLSLTYPPFRAAPGRLAERPDTG